MDDTARKPGRRGRIAGAAGLLAAGALAGGVLAGSLSASADGGSGAAADSSAKPSGPSTAQHWHDGFRGGPGGPHSVRPDEQQLTGADADKARAAALKAVPGGTVIRLESDAGDAAYEAHMTKSDGSFVTVKLDKNLSVVKVESGMGAGEPRPGGAPAAGSSSSTGA